MAVSQGSGAAGGEKVLALRFRMWALGLGTEALGSRKNRFRVPGWVRIFLESK